MIDVVAPACSEGSGIQVGVRKWLLETMTGTIETKFWSISKPWPILLDRKMLRWETEVQCRGLRQVFEEAGRRERREPDSEHHCVPLHMTWIYP